jgi:hypothetical protein
VNEVVTKVLALIAGIICIIIGVWGLISWWSYFIKALMASIPALLILLGIILAIFGYSELKSLLAEKKEKKEET